MKRWLRRSIAVTAMLIVIILVAFGIWKAKTCETRANECISNPAMPGESNKPTPPIEAIQACRESQDYFCRVVAPANFPNILLVLAGFLGIFVAFDTLRILERQTKATEDSVKIAIETARPKLMLHHIEMSDTLGAASLEAVLQYLAVLITFKNFGKTEAFLVSQSVDFLCGGPGELPDEPIYEHRIDWTPETVVEYGKTQALGVHRPDDLIPDNDIRAIIDRSKALWIYGYVSYRDYSGNYYYTRFGKSILVHDRANRTFYFWECDNKKYTENT